MASTAPFCGVIWRVIMTNHHGMDKSNDHMELYRHADRFIVNDHMDLFRGLE